MKIYDRGGNDIVQDWKFRRALRKATTKECKALDLEAKLWATDPDAALVAAILREDATPEGQRRIAFAKAVEQCLLEGRGLTDEEAALRPKVT